MPNDVVIDTNVLVHAENKAIKVHQECVDFINYLTDSSESLCFDEGFAWHETFNKSQIAHEYLNNLRYGTMGYMLVVRLATSKRITEVSRTVSKRATNIITQTVSKRRDRVFLKVAFNSENKILISNDFEDFQVPKRTLFRKQLGLQVIIPSDYEKIPPEINFDEI